MKVCVTQEPITNIAWEAMILGVAEEDAAAQGAETWVHNLGVTDDSGEVISRWLDKVPHPGKKGEVRVVAVPGNDTLKFFVLVGLGKKAAITSDVIRYCFGEMARVVQKYGIQHVAVPIRAWERNGVASPAFARAMVEGVGLGSYRYIAFKKDQKQEKPIDRLTIFIPDTYPYYAWEKSAHLGSIMAQAVNQARDMTNAPANYLTPRELAKIAVALGRQYGFAVTVLDREAAARAGLTSFLAVARGSHEPPTFTVLRYQGRRDSTECLALVGKGITFDSGGISLKPDEGLAEMKTDMAGAAAVLAAMQVIGELKPSVNVMAVLPATENMPGGSALKPGDVISSLGGISIEVISTDAEGRLILADALAYARQNGATKLVDVATLTGACVVALGHVASGVMANNDLWCHQVMQAAAKAGETMWQLPQFPAYREQIESTVADIKNSGGRPAGCITAGMFLSTFAGDTPWVHIDIAGTAEAEKDQGCNVKGATGVGVRTLAQLALDLSDES